MTKREKNFIDQVRNRIAQISVGSSAIRNQGAPGLIPISRNFFYKTIDLKEFRRKITTNGYTDYLNKLTNALVKKFPKEGRSWGAARKGINLYLREVAYNHYLAYYLNISSDFFQNLEILKNLEVPLDNDVATGLIENCGDLPKWKSIKNLNEADSAIFQIKAAEYAARKKTIRVHLDLEFWRRNR